MSGGLSQVLQKVGNFEFVNKRSPPVRAGNFKSVFVHTNDNTLLSSLYILVHIFRFFENWLSVIWFISEYIPLVKWLKIDKETKDILNLGSQRLKLQSGLKSKKKCHIRYSRHYLYQRLKSTIYNFFNVAILHSA